MERQRVTYLDMMRGVAIFVVVMGHVMVFGMRDVQDAPIYRLLDAVQMPLFFFVSGWVTYRLTVQGQLKSPSLWRRTRQLIIPFFVMSGLWLWYFPHSHLVPGVTYTWWQMMCQSMKVGYWFTPCLWMIIAIYWALTPLLRRWGHWWQWLLILGCAWVVLYLISRHVHSHIVWGLLMMPMVTAYSVPFIFGVIANKYKDTFYRLVANQWVYGVCVIALGVFLYLINRPEAWHYGAKGYICLQALFHVVLAVVAVGVFSPWAQRTQGQGRWARMWVHLGRKSLGIYLLQYFFLFPMWWVAEIAAFTAYSFVFIGVVAAVVAAVITACCLGVIYIIERSPVLAQIMIGRLPVRDAAASTRDTL